MNLESRKETSIDVNYNFVEIDSVDKPVAVWKSENVVTRFSQKFSFGKLMLFCWLYMTS